MNNGSYPNPRSPISISASEPSHTPSAMISRPSGNRNNATVLNLQDRVLPASSRNIFERLSASVACPPAKRAVRTPGAPFNASTSNPVSSANAGKPVAVHTATAFSRALPTSVSASSTTSASAAGRGCKSTTPPIKSNISATLCGLAEAHTARNTTTCRVAEALVAWR